MESSDNNKPNKLKEKLNEQKKSRDAETQWQESKKGAIAFMIQIIVGLSQMLLMFAGYTILSNHYNLTQFNIWEFSAIALGTFSFLTFVRNYIKNIFKKS
jgi:hypothetical protein